MAKSEDDANNTTNNFLNGRKNGNGKDISRCGVG